MNKAAAMQHALAAAFERGSRFIQKRWRRAAASGDIFALCKILMSSRGEISGGALAARVLDLYLSLPEADKDKFFAMLAGMNPDPARVAAAARGYAAAPDAVALAALAAAAEPPRQELFRRLNIALGGTAALVEMRRLLLEKTDAHPEFLCIDRDLVHLFSSWFNRGFLKLEEIHWGTAATILEKIIAYEAIHKISDWDELRRRLQPPDRRCFGFFHPVLSDEPLIFTEVALLDAIPDNVACVLQAKKRVDPQQADTAVFYSISKCHDGLRGIPFGNLLIKQVAQQLARELPGLKNFVTLSPAPGLLRWVEEQARRRGEAKEALQIVARAGWHKNAKQARRAEELLPPLAAEYFLRAKRADGFPADSVARFHLGNGAVLWRINWLADASPARMQQSAGLMVNYRYVLDDAEDNHEHYARGGEPLASGKVRAMLKASEETDGAPMEKAG